MCGIAGTFGFRPEVAQDLVTRMGVNMTRRGPDDGGVETFGWDDACVGLGSRRLAIIDPSPAGHQPMVDEDRGIALVFNGMIYNFAELREHLIARGETFNMSQGLEVRVPFLDDRVVDWSLRLPTETSGQAPKSLLREAAQGLIPNEVLARRKQGFVLPLDRWMRHELRARMDDLFRSPPSALDGLLDTRAVLDVWQQRYLRGAAAPLRSSHEWLRPWSLYVLYQWTANLEAGAPLPESAL